MPGPLYNTVRGWGIVLSLHNNNAIWRLIIRIRNDTVRVKLVELHGDILQGRFWNSEQNNKIKQGKMVV